MKTAILVHGGAGNWDSLIHHRAQAISACIEAVQSGKSILQAGGFSLDAVESAVCVLENSPVLDAGLGSFLNSQGNIQMDALIMDGSTLNLGAVAAVQHIKNPIRLARRVLHNDQYNFLIGAGAEAFAKEIGFEFCDTGDLITEDNLKDYISRSGTATTAAPTSSLGDTVGAVAFDMHGNLAVATSTGGTRHKLPGRVGDSPLVGSGGYADNMIAAVGATGEGESLMKVVISKQVCDYIGNGLSVQDACDAAIQLLSERVGGHGGLIAIDKQGKLGVAYNTSSMPYAYCVDNESIISGH